MAAQVQKDMSGILFPERNKKNEKGPDVTGRGTIGGVEYRVAGWKREGSGGGKFYSLSLEHGDQKSAKGSDELTGVLFPEKDKRNDKAPDLTGKVTVGGTVYRIAAWKKSGQNGAFYSLAFELPRDAADSKPTAKPAPTPDDDDMF